MKVILPKTRVDPELYRHKKLFFLAGPVRGGGDWQQHMCKELDQLLVDYVVAIPQRYSDDHPLQQYRLSGDENGFSRQLDWESFYLDEASRSGGVVFWLGFENAESPHPGPEPYAMDTRGELGEWRTHKQYRPDVRLFIGADERFYGLSQIERNCKRQIGPDFRIYPSMRELAHAAAGYGAVR
ncbi:MAG TPA: hypothetical protein VEB18_04355 [Candidatus Paceibacterota bacterium]|nr:hypothetical protein [Candidatus Paceibacterota bacterium]